MRLFVAINLPEDVREALHEEVAPLREEGYPVRWLPSENYHLTLKFLGPVRDERVGTVEQATERVAAQTPPFSLEIQGVGAFPSLRRPRVLWVGVAPTPALRCFKQDLEWALAEHDFERETRAFHPHVTVGRVKSDEGAGAFRGLDRRAGELAVRHTVPVQTVEVMRSRRSREGSRYTVVRSSPLRVEAPRAS